MKQYRRNFLAFAGTGASFGLAQTEAAASNSSSDNPSPQNHRKEDVKIVNNGQREYEIEIVVTKQGAPDDPKATRDVTLGGRNEPGGPKKPVKSTIERLDFNGGDTHKVVVTIDEEERGGGYVVTNSHGMGPFVAVHVGINPFGDIRVDTVA